MEELRRSVHRQAGRFRRDPDPLSQDPKHPGRKAGQGKWARRAEPTDEQKANALTKSSQLDCCPASQGELLDVAEHEHNEWDIPPVVPVLTRFLSESGYCPCCQRRFRSRHPDQISQATGAAGAHCVAERSFQARPVAGRSPIAAHEVAITPCCPPRRKPGPSPQ